MGDFPLAVVTGGGLRLGRGLALCLAEEGYGLLVHYHASGEAASRTADLAKRMKVPAFSFQADLRDPRQVQALFSHVDALVAAPDSGLGRLQVLVNSAARFTPAEAANMPVEEWDDTLDLNLRAPFLCAQQAARRMAPGGLIVNITDIAARKTWSRFPAYSVSKAGLEALTRILARAFAPEIRVNAIAPGLVLPAEGIPAQEWDRLVDRLPLRRTASVAEVGAALRYLIRNAYVTGQVLAVDGGYSLI